MLLDEKQYESLKSKRGKNENRYQLVEFLYNKKAPQCEAVMNIIDRYSMTFEVILIPYKPL